MKKNHHSSKKVYKEVNNLLNEFIEKYKNKLNQNLISENISIEDLNKISAILAKNIPDIIKFKEIISEKISLKNESNQTNYLLNKAMNDEIGQEIISKLLIRISEISNENKE